VKGNRLDEILQTSTPKTEMAQAEDLGACASQPIPKGWTGLYVLNGKEDTRAFQYVHLGYANHSADGTSFVVEFNEPEKWRLTVKGRKLWKVFVNIHQHALEWIKKVDRDFEDGTSPVITDIKVELVAERGA
jgi:hypothetical protein